MDNKNHDITIENTDGSTITFAGVEAISCGGEGSTVADDICIEAAGENVDDVSNK